MSLLGKIWEMHKPAPADFLESGAEHSDVAKQLFWNRELKNEDDIDKFLNPSYEDLHDPGLLKDIDRAVSRISAALDGGEDILIYGDYDADGVCGSALLKEVFEELGAKNVEVYIPHREDEGYGMNLEAVEGFIEDKKDLIVTVDCGSSNIEEINLAQENGIDVVVIDHHQVTRDNNPAFAHVNPHQEGDKYIFKNLAGTGVAFKVCSALIDFRRKKGAQAPHQGWEKWLLDLVAIATVTDVMPLKGENRTLVKYGLYVLAQKRRPGLNALMEKASVDATFEAQEVATNLNAFTLGFILGPRLNSAGRMEHADIAFDLLTAKTKKDADVLAHILDTKNKERKKLVEDIIAEIDTTQLNNSSAIVAGSKNWPIGVAGIVAGRLAEKYNKPAFIYQKKGSKLVGSARGPEYLNIVEIMQHCDDFLIKYGGHRQAGGFSANVADEEILARNIQTKTAMAAGKLDRKDIIPKAIVEAEISPDDINWNLYDELLKFAPHGEANQKPIFLLRDVILKNPRMVGEGKDHFKCVVETGKGKRLKAIGFRFPSDAAHIQDGAEADILFHLDKNEWDGTRELDLKLVDIKTSHLL
ncbi:MAG: single-stranded-DNA-specific exonuclease RecJ [Candidatus Spechtbacterales bacterium]|nr:single-stranded-DNA-specific exonuclease RecJ [Candidatus Spechtbacterales bacterium]